MNRRDWLQAVASLPGLAFINPDHPSLTAAPKATLYCLKCGKAGLHSTIQGLCGKCLAKTMPDTKWKQIVKVYQTVLPNYDRRYGPR